MVLYFVKTTYQLLECIIHKFTVHEAEDAVLLINNGHVKNYPNYEQLEQFGFKKIIIYTTGKITSKETDDKRKFVNDIVKYYDELFEKDSIDLDMMSCIYSFAALRFSIYLIEKKKKFFLFEDGVGAAKTLGLVLWRENLDKVDKNALARKYGLFDGSNSLISNIYYNPSKGILDNSKAVFYDVSKELEKLSEERRDSIISFFSKEHTKRQQEVDNLVLFRHCYAGSESFDSQQSSLLEFVLDWFGVEGNFVVKTHPMDMAHYKEYPNVEWIDRQLPSELLPYVIGDKVINLIAVATTSFYSFSERAFRTCYLSYDVAEMKRGISREVMALKLIREVGLEKHVFSIYGMYTQISKIVIEKYYQKDVNVLWGNFGTNEKEVLLIDELIWGKQKNDCKKELNRFMRRCDAESIVVFLDSKGNMEFCKCIDEEMFPYMLSYHIEYDFAYGTKLSEYIHIWCKSDMLRKRLAYSRSIKFLPFTQTVVRISIAEGWERIKMQSRIAMEKL